VCANDEVLLVLFRLSNEKEGGAKEDFTRKTDRSLSVLTVQITD